MKKNSTVVPLLGLLFGAAFAVSPEASTASNHNESLALLLAETIEEALDIPDSDQFAPTARDWNCAIGKSEVSKINAQLFLQEAEIMAAKKQHAPFGLAHAKNNDETLIVSEYLINYDPILRIPSYASYRLEKKDIVRRKRVHCFREDPRLEISQRSKLVDYRNTGFQRGHLVPRADMNRSRTVMLNTYVLSNMMPQYGHFNGGIWKTLEASVRAWAIKKRSVLVVTGPIFDYDADGKPDEPDSIIKLEPREKVAIPSHFFKIVLHTKPSGFVNTLSVVLAHSNGEELKSITTVATLDIIEANLTSIDKIEELTGFDFFPDMPAAKQRAVERAVASGLWQ